MRKIIDWKLINKHEELINLKDVYCDYIPNKKLIYVDESGRHIIDLKENIYTREGNDYSFLVNFSKREAIVKLSSGERCSFGIECENYISNTEIRLMYKMDEEEKIIIIKMKEDGNENNIN